MKKRKILLFLSIISLQFISSIFIATSYSSAKEAVSKEVQKDIINIVLSYESNYDESFLYEKPYFPEKYVEYCENLCEKEDIPLLFFSKVIMSESRWKDRPRDNYNYKIYNGKKTLHSVDRGIAMLNSKNLEEFSWRFNDGEKIDPYNPYVSLKVSARYLSWLYDRLGNWYLVSCAYKTGIGNVRAGKIPTKVQTISEAIANPLVSPFDPFYFL